MMEEEVISLEEIFAAIKRSWKLITAITLLTTIISGVVSVYFLKPVYETNAKLFVGKEAGSEDYNYNDITMYQKLVSTYTETIKTKDLINKSLKSIDCDLTATSVLANLSVNEVADTQIIKVSYKNGNAELAADVLNAITKEFIETSKKMISNGNVQIIESVEVPEHPVSPNKKMILAIGFMMGLMGSLGIVFIKEYLDNTYKNKEQLERELGIPVVGVIPFSNEI